MTDMLERCARALAMGVTSGVDCYTPSSEDVKVMFENAAKDVLRTLMEPTEDMLWAVNDSDIFTGEKSMRVIAKEVWQAMIQAALGERT